LIRESSDKNTKLSQLSCVFCCYGYF